MKTPPAGSRRPRPGRSTVIPPPPPPVLEEATLCSYQSPGWTRQLSGRRPKHGKATWCDPGTRPVFPPHLLHQPAGWGRGFHLGVRGAGSRSEGHSHSTPTGARALAGAEGRGSSILDQHWGSTAPLSAPGGLCGPSPHRRARPQMGTDHPKPSNHGSMRPQSPWPRSARPLHLLPLVPTPSTGMSHTSCSHWATPWLSCPQSSPSRSHPLPCVFGSECIPPHPQWQSRDPSPAQPPPLGGPSPS